MSDETVRLAEYAAGLRYDDIPPAVAARARAGIADTVAACICGSAMPWSRIVIAYAEQAGPGGASRILGRGSAVQAPAAALANGALAHAFELDSLTRPGAGVHPGATLLPPALAVAQAHGRSGRDVIAAFVAGAEVMIRIGRATGHSNEARGFHAPGTTGPFGAAVAAGHLLGLDATGMAHALGIAGSLAAGLLEFAGSRRGGMVKRLHLGRASESGVLAASLAAGGFTGPDTVLEGEFGFLRVFCTEWDMAALTRDLGTDFVTLSTVMKRYPCHINAHPPVAALRELQQAHGFAAGEVAGITITAGARVVARHDIPEPADLMLAQYSVPFCAALALYRDPRDPGSFDASALADPAIRALCRNVRLEEGSESTVTVALADGRNLTRAAPAAVLDDGDLADKFARLTRGVMAEDAAMALFGRLSDLDAAPDLAWLGAAGGAV